MKILFLGGPGTGKSTVGQRLAKDLGWPLISSGAILRESKEPWVLEKLKTAQLFDDQMITELIFARLEGVENAIIDGFPRTLGQAEAVAKRGMKIDLMVEMVVPLEEINRRLAERGREQDSPEIIAERWTEYERGRTEIMAFLVGNGVKALAVDGVGTMDEVYKRTLLEIRRVMK